MSKSYSFPMFLSALLLCLEVSHAQDWRAFRGPIGDGSSKFENLPTEWGVDKNVTWKKELPGEGWSSPVVAGATVVITAAVPQEKELVDTKYDLVVMALDLQTGKLIWNTTVFVQPVDAPARHQSEAGLILLGSLPAAFSCNSIRKHMSCPTAHDLHQGRSDRSTRP